MSEGTAQSEGIKLELLRPYKGGEELRRAAAALGGSANTKELQVLEQLQEGQLPAVHPTPVQVPEGADHHVRELAFAAQRYAKAAQRDTADFDAVYNHGLALQELATRLGAAPSDQLRLLNQACQRYEAAWRLRESSHAALYNWGVALSDIARVVKAGHLTESSPGGGPAQAHAFLLQAAEKYALSLRWNPNNPQALNNWGLVLQELSTMRPPAERQHLVNQSVAKFRRAIRLRPEFDRACYNLGTVFYAHACVLQNDAMQHLSSQLTQDPQDESREQTEEHAYRQTFALASQYICVSFALQPTKTVYRRSLGAVQAHLPLPFLRAGPLMTCATETAGTCHERWERRWFVLDQTSFRASSAPAETSGQAESASQQAEAEQTVDLADIAAVKVCMDPSLPKGFAFWLGLLSQPHGLYFLADTSGEAEGWVDALHMVAFIASQKQLASLGQALVLVTDLPSQKRPSAGYQNGRKPGPGSKS
ncbi:hypothetical protein WJX72_010561 [[Myrmecia] bisecta]|uniref:PH domain-containing protein n=1 Tax=[Myrmecia] bisecta TaxID=41462 RepID=A0AAW1P0W7_9CHLO